MNILLILLLACNLNSCKANNYVSSFKKIEIEKIQMDVVEQIFIFHDKNKNKFLSLQEFYNFLSVCNRRASKKNFELWITGILYYDSFFENKKKILNDNKISKKELDNFMNNDLIYRCLECGEKGYFTYKKDAENYKFEAKKYYNDLIGCSRRNCSSRS